MTPADEQPNAPSQILLSVAAAMTGLWKQNVRSPRLGTPILRTVEVLLLHTPLLEQGTGAAEVLGKTGTWSGRLSRLMNRFLASQSCCVTSCPQAHRLRLKAMLLTLLSCISMLMQCSLHDCCATLEDQELKEHDRCSNTLRIDRQINLVGDYMVPNHCKPACRGDAGVDSS